MVKDVGWQMPEPSEQAAMYHPALLQPGTGVNVAVRVHDPTGFAPRLRAWRVPWTLEMQTGRRAAAERQWPRRDPHLGGTSAGRRRLPAGAVALGLGNPRPDVVHRRAPDARRSAFASPWARRQRRIVSGIFARAFLQVAVGILAGSAIVAPKIDFGSLTQVTYLIGADAIMLIAGLAACALPLRRALTINPTDALRAEA